MWLKTQNDLDNNLKGISIVEVSGESCANCLTLMPILNRLVSKMDGVNLFHIEADNDTMPLIEKFEIMAVPTILVLYNQEIKARCKGFQPEEILELWLDAKVEEIRKELK
ncbi:MAG: thioredoxin family protein [Acholeplasmatales bacterium]|nr:thioredoxin family protein [Acholeplasmatales bacterium]